MRTAAKNAAAAFEKIERLAARCAAQNEGGKQEKAPKRAGKIREKIHETRKLFLSLSASHFARPKQCAAHATEARNRRGRGGEKNERGKNTRNG